MTFANIELPRTSNSTQRYQSVIAVQTGDTYIRDKGIITLEEITMNADTKRIIWGQFGAAIDTLEKVIRACPEDLWFDLSRYHQIWHMAHHTIFWLDYYLTENTDEFKPPEPFGLEELDPAGVIPENPYSQDELLKYLDHSRRKCRETIAGMTEERASKKCGFKKADITQGELLLYNLRHVQHHAAQINLLLRLHSGTPAGWVFQSKIDLDGNNR